jgi:thiamine biosynthesis lipoprotein
MQGWGRWSAVLAAAGAAVAAPAQAETPAWRFHADPVLGTSLDLVAVTRDPADARRAADAARAEIDRLDSLLSGWRPDSELSRLNRSDALAVSPELYAVLSACEQWRTRTGGAFDARQGQVFALRRTAEATEPQTLRRLWTAASEAQVRLDPATRTVFRPQTVTFAPEALAKGYAVDAAMAAARAAAPELAGLMIDIGGDLRCWGQGPANGGWTVGVAEPFEAGDNAAPAVLLRADGRALATGGARADDGYNHIAGGDGHLRASVIAPTAAQADALATALCAMPAQAGMTLAESMPGVEARTVDADGRVRTTSGWRSLVLAPDAPPARLIRTADAAANPAAAPWPAKFAVTIDYRLPQKEARAYSPYVAIWITDENSKLVRGLAMLGGKLDYVSENYIWWRRFGRARPQIVAAISRPTKRAGKYSIVWDGKGDDGQPVGQGKYTVHIEATREDGLHSYQAMEVMLGADPAQAAAEAGDELGAADLHYGRR